MNPERMARLRAMFVDEASTRVAGIVQGLLALERGGADAGVVDAVLRDAHTLKGAASMVGLPDVGRLAHELESVVEPLRDRGGDDPADPAAVEAALALADAIAAAVGAGSARPAGAPAPGSGSRSEPEPVSAVEVEEDAGVARLPVSLQRLDEVVRLAGEVRSGLVRLRAAVEAGSAHSGPALDLLRDVERAAAGLQGQVVAARTVPVRQVAGRLQRAVRDAAKQRGVQAAWVLEGGDVEVDRAVLDRVEAALLHVVRNAVAHGIEPPDVRAAAGKPAAGTVALRAASRRGRVVLSVRDDGRGLDREALVEQARRRGVDVGGDWTRAMFGAGVSTASGVDELAGRGVGMDVVLAAARAARGDVVVRSDPGRGTEVLLDLPVSLAIVPCLEVVAAGGRYALPLEAVLAVGADDAGHEHAGHEDAGQDDVGGAGPLVDLAGALGAAATPGAGRVVRTRSGVDALRLRVDDVVGQRDVVVQPLGRAVPPTDLVVGTALATDGSPLVVLDPAALARRGPGLTAARPAPTSPAGAAAAAPVAAKRVLVVDDAAPIRELVGGILERAGYVVAAAGDGRAALELLRAGTTDLLLTDVEMPRMDGYALTEAVRADPATAAVPVLMLTALDDDEHRRRGLESGADGYLVKTAFSAERLLAAVAAQIGRP